MISIRFMYINLKREFFVALLITIFVYSIFILTDFIELWFDLTREYEKYELDEILGLVLGATFGLLYLSIKLLNHYKSDRSRIYQLSNELANQVNNDDLTGLPNRFAFKKFTQDLIEDSKKLNNRFTMFYIDLDGFKFINDMLGYSVGDSILVQTAKRLNVAISQNAMLSRIGGDEFLLFYQATLQMKCA